MAADPSLTQWFCLPGLGLLAPESALSPAVGWEGRIKAQGLFDPSLERRQVCSCLRRAARRRCSEDAPTAPKGTLRRPGHETSSGRALAGWQTSFLHFTMTLPPWRAQPPKMPKTTAARTADTERPRPQPGAQCQPETRPGDPARPPAPPGRRTLIPSRRQRLPPPAGEGAQSHPRR